MDKDKMLKIFGESKSITEICKKIYGKKTASTYYKVIAMFKELNYKWEERVKEIKDSNKKHCLNCGKGLNGRSQKMFCSISCAAQYNNKSRKKNDEERYCATCGKLLKSYQKVYCSPECQHQHNTKSFQEYIEKWKRGEESGCTPSYKIDKRVKEYLLEKYNYSCQICGWNTVNKFTGNVPLQIHHIDGNCTNNSEENLQLLCPNCHALTENFGSRNKNSKRVFRKQKLFKQEIIK